MHRLLVLGQGMPEVAKEEMVREREGGRPGAE